MQLKKWVFVNKDGGGPGRWKGAEVSFLFLGVACWIAHYFFVVAGGVMAYTFPSPPPPLPPHALFPGKPFWTWPFLPP